MAGGRKRVKPGTKRTVAQPTPTVQRRSRNAAGKTQAGRAAAKQRADAAAAAVQGASGTGVVGAAGAAAQNYLSADKDRARAAANFNATESERLRANSAAKKAKLQATQAAGQRVSGRAASRAVDQARVHGRTDAEKIESRAQSDRTGRILRDVGLAVAPGGAAGAVTAKVGYAKKGLQLARTGLRTASKLGKGSLAKGAKAAGQVALNRAKKAGTKKLASAAAVKAAKFAKYKGKIKAKGYANQYAAGASNKT